FPPDNRKDALVAASEMVLAIDKAKEAFNNMLTTVGVFNVEPSNVSMSAGRVSFTYDVRHTSDDLRKQAINIIEEQLMTIAKKRNVKINKNQIWDMKSAVFSQDIIDLIEQGAKNYECTYQFIQSGAGHDAKFI